MNSFDLCEARAFVTGLDHLMDLCDNGEGRECMTLDGTLKKYAFFCCELVQQVRSWARAVFAGQVEFDLNDEATFKDGLERLRSRAESLLSYSQQKEQDCFVFEGQRDLAAALHEVCKLLDNWLSPQLSVGPAARQGLPLSAQEAEAARQRLASLPPLPADWQPEYSQQQKLLKKLGG